MQPSMAIPQALEILRHNRESTVARMKIHEQSLAYIEQSEFFSRPFKPDPNSDDVSENRIAAILQAVHLLASAQLVQFAHNVAEIKRQIEQIDAQIRQLENPLYVPNGGGLIS